MFYKPETQIIPTENMSPGVTDMIISTLNRFSPIIQKYLEDHMWTANYKKTLNFDVRQNKVVFSNTISTEDAMNNNLTHYLDLMIRYVKKVFKLKSIKYKIIEDNKFDISWILIESGYL